MGPHQDLGIGERELGQESIFFLLEKDTNSFDLKPGLSLRMYTKGLVGGFDLKSPNPVFSWIDKILKAG